MSVVLYLAANPSDLTALRLDVECREISDALRSGPHRDRLVLTARWAARADDLLRALVDEAPQALHFSGHGEGEGGLAFVGDDGTAQPVSGAALAQVMAAAGGSVRLVLLNACYSAVQATALSAHVPCVIGTTRAVTDAGAARYSAALYRALAAGRSVANAHAQGLAALALHGDADRDAIALHVRPGTDPDRVVVVDPIAPGPTTRPRPRPRRFVLAIAAVLVGTTAAASIGYRLLRRDPAPVVHNSTVIQQSGSNGVNINGSGSNVNVYIDRSGPGSATGGAP